MPFFLQTMTGAGAPCAGHQRDEEWLRRKNWVSATLSRLGLAGKKKKEFLAITKAVEYKKH